MKIDKLKQLIKNVVHPIFLRDRTRIMKEKTPAAKPLPKVVKQINKKVDWNDQISI